MIDKETIEEKAVEYVLATFYEDYSTEEKKDILKENSRYFRDKVNLFIKAYDMGQNDEFEFNNRMAIRNAKKMKELTEGKPKWHDLRKDPSDLPKKDGTYLVSILLSNQIVTDTHEYRDGYFSKHLRIIAWCELPKFEE